MKYQLRHFTGWALRDAADTIYRYGDGHDRPLSALAVLICSLILIVAYGEHHIALFVPGLDIPVGLGDLFERVAPVDNWFELPRFDKLFKENHIFHSLDGNTSYCLFAAGDR